ncbi:MAG: hypothetical protein FJ276_09645 [Planctomycetes bacterium]|nr:hypothetical protein [Planctomycetota bacterium]
MTDRQNPRLSTRSALWLVLLGLLVGWAGRGIPDAWLGVIFTSALLLPFIVALAMPLLIARRFGYRLMWGRETFAGSQPGGRPGVSEDAMRLRVLDARSSRNDDL